jgi:hypothetical protein
MSGSPFDNRRSRRISGLLLAGLLMLGGLPATASAADPELPIPPVPPPQPSSGFLAPTPDPSIQAPVTLADESMSVRPQFYRSSPLTSIPSAGYLPGSRYQDSEDQKPIQTPGFIVTVPLR